MRPQRHEGRLLLLMAALGGGGPRPPNKKILKTVPGYPDEGLDGMRALRRDLRDLAQSGLRARPGGTQLSEELAALQLLGPVAGRSRRFPFRDPILRAWRRTGAAAPSVPGGLSVVSLGSDWPAKVEFLHRAVMDRRRIGFQYLRPSRRRGFKFHELDPYGLGLRDASWYAAGFDRGRKAVALFKLSRMRRERVLPGTFARPPDFDLRSFLSAPAWTYGKKLTAVLVEARSSALRALRELPGVSRKIKPAGRAARVVLRCGDLLDLARWILPFGSEIRVLGPRRARQVLRGEARRVAGF